MTLTIGSLFTGYGGLDMAVEAVTGGRTIWRSDIDPGACKVIAHHWPDDPNLGDITAIDWLAVGRPEILTGGFPCQDVSAAGRRAGLRPGTRSGLWQQMARAIDILRPSLVVAENVRGLLSADAHSDVEPCPWCVGDPGDEPPLRALGAVLGDLADIGYDAAWHGLTAASVGAPHGRFRVFILAWPAEDSDRSTRDQRVTAPGQAPRGWPRPDACGSGRARIADADRSGPQGAQSTTGRHLLDGRAASDAARDGRHEGWPEPTGFIGGSDAPECCDEDPSDADYERLAWLRRKHTSKRDPDGCREPTPSPPDPGCVDVREQSVPEPGRSGPPIAGHPISWGQFEPAIRRWERLTRPAPAPTEASARGTQRLSPRFVEWMMGLPVGHVTDVPGLTRNEQLKALGNGVVRQQAEAGLRVLFDAMAVAA